MRYPLFFTYTDRIETDHWSAIVVARGRCLMEFRDDQWWIEAVEPGGFTGHDSVPALAMRHFRATWSEVLDDIAHDRVSVDEFNAELTKHFEQKSAPADREWLEARDVVRRGAALEKPFDTLPKENQEAQASFQVYVEDSEAESVVDELALPDAA